MSDELKLCPFCGGEAEAHEIGVTIECVHTDGTRDAYEMVAVGCVNEECPVMPCTKASGNVAEAVEKWNARAAVTDEQFALAVHEWALARMEGCDEPEWSMYSGIVDAIGRHRAASAKVVG